MSSKTPPSFTAIDNAANNGQPDYSSAARGDGTNCDPMQFGARLGTAIPNPLINNTNYIYAMQFGARWGLVVPNLFIDANCNDANCDDANCDDANCDDASCDDAYQKVVV